MDVGRIIAELTDRILGVPAAVSDMSEDGDLAWFPFLDTPSAFQKKFLALVLYLFLKLAFKVEIVDFQEVILSLQLCNLPLQ